MEDRLNIVNKTRSKVPALPILALKNKILGEDYELSVAYLSENKIKEFNTIYRGKNKSTNVLSFSLNKNSGELLLCPIVIKKETKIFNKNFKDLTKYLIIHGMLHLKGLDHGAKMEKEEQKYL